MRAGAYNITCEQGSTFVRLIEIEQPDLITDPTGETYEPFNLSGYTARMQARRTIESTNFFLMLTTENGGLTVNPGDADNEILIYIEDEVTASINSSNPGSNLNGVYDLEIINPSGEVSRLLEGTFTLKAEVTR